MLSPVRLLATPWTAAFQAHPSMGFSRQEYWSGVPLPSPISSLPMYISWGFKITADGDCSHEIKTLVLGRKSVTKLLERKVMTNLDSVLKSRDITLPTTVCLIKAMFFPVVMYGCENWTIKKAEHRRTDAFELWCWRGLLRVPWTARRSNQSILKKISPGCSWKD